MVFTININNGIKENTYGFRNCSTTHILLLGGYVKVRDCLHTRVVIWSSAILNQIDTKAILSRYQSLQYP